MNKNIKAFLDTIAESEGTRKIPDSDDGYKAVVGGGVFNDYSRHPNRRIYIPRLALYSTAAGRYQILYRFWKVYQNQLHLKDFSPASQDAVALQLIHECHAWDDIEQGNFSAAVAKCSSRWASLPGAGYGQHEHTLEHLASCFAACGGVEQKGNLA